MAEAVLELGRRLMQLDGPGVGLHLPLLGDPGPPSGAGRHLPGLVGRGRRRHTRPPEALGLLGVTVVLQGHLQQSWIRRLIGCLGAA
jgi:hypothetical protein